MKKIYIVVLILLMHIDAYAQWSAINKTDDFTDKKIKYLSYKTKGTIIQIDIEEKYNLFPRIAIERKKIGGISPETSVEIRVDKKKKYVVDMGYWVDVHKRANTKMIDRTAYLDNKTILFTLDLASYDDRDFWCDITKGNFLKLRYSLNDGSKESLKISLKDITNKIRTVFGSELIKNCK